MARPVDARFAHPRFHRPHCVDEFAARVEILLPVLRKKRVFRDTIAPQRVLGIRQVMQGCEVLGLPSQPKIGTVKVLRARGNVRGVEILIPVASSLQKSIS